MNCYNQVPLFFNQFQTRVNLCSLYLTSLFITFVCVALANTATAQSIKVVARADYFNDNLIQKFEQKTGISVDVTVYDPRNSREITEKVLSGTDDFDLLILPSNALAVMIETDKVQRLTDVSGINQISSRIQNYLLQYTGNPNKPVRLYGIPFMWGTTGIGYHVEEFIDSAPNSLAQIFNPELIQKYANCGVGIADAPNEIIGAALAYLGLSPASRTDEDLAAAEEVLMKIRPYVRGIYGNEMGIKLERGDLCLAYGWSGDLVRSVARTNRNTRLKKVGYATPIDGTPLWIDLFAIPVRVENTDAVKEFIQYLMDATIAAEITQRTFFVSANVSANMQNGYNEFFDGNDAFPNPDIIKTMFVAPAMSGEEMDKVSKLWARVTAPKE